MPRKQVGAIDADLLAEVDRRAAFLGQTRRMFVERTLQARIAQPDWKLTDTTGCANPSAPGPNAENVRNSSRAKRNVPILFPYPIVTETRER